MMRLDELFNNIVLENKTLTETKTWKMHWKTSSDELPRYIFAKSKEEAVNKFNFRFSTLKENLKYIKEIKWTK